MSYKGTETWRFEVRKEVKEVLIKSSKLAILVFQTKNKTR